MHLDPILRTDRLILRPPNPDDAAKIQAAANDIEVSRWLTHVPHPYDLADAKAYLARVRAGDMGSTYVIADAHGFVGTIGLYKELGYWLARSAWGRGYASEAARAVLRAHFRDPDAAAVGSSYFAGNVRSARVLQKLGFGDVTDGARRVVPEATGAPVLCHAMALTPEQWHALNPWVIETERLRLRPVTPGDVPDIARIGGDPRVAPMIFAATIGWTEREAARFVERFRWRGRLGFRMGLERDGAVIGTVGLGTVAAGKAPEVAYFLDPDHWGQGIISEALTAFLPAAMDRLNLTEIRAEAFDDNPASQAVLARQGFQRIGRGLGGSAARLEPAPVSVYRLARKTLGST